jgi:hypothetical protein
MSCVCIAMSSFFPIPSSLQTQSHSMFSLLATVSRKYTSSVCFTNERLGTATMILLEFNSLVIQYPVKLFPAPQGNTNFPLLLLSSTKYFLASSKALCWCGFGLYGRNNFSFQLKMN